MNVSNRCLFFLLGICSWWKSVTVHVGYLAQGLLRLHIGPNYNKNEVYCGFGSCARRVDGRKKGI